VDNYVLSRFGVLEQVELNHPRYPAEINFRRTIFTELNNPARYA
jgi:hypothetical protein